MTGSSLGSGRSIARTLAQHGAAVVVHHTADADAAAGSPDAARDTVASLAAAGATAHALDVDLAAPGGGRRTVERASALAGPVDILVVCASIQYREAFVDVTEAQMERQWAINLRATVELLQAALPSMQARRWGRVLTIGSINEVRPNAELTVYAALKAAQANLAMNLARQYAPFNVMINNLAPGLVATERNRRLRDDPATWRRMEATAAAPMGRAAQPDEMAGAALLLCSDAASYIAGANLLVTGGAHVAAP